MRNQVLVSGLQPQAQGPGTLVMGLSLLLLLLHLQGPQPVDALKCWACVNSEGHVDYDVNCGSSGYVSGDADHVEEDDHQGYTCYTAVYDDGYIYRSVWHASGHVDGDCFIESGYTLCYCTGDLCNDGLCQHCFTTTTDEPATTIKVTTTSTTFEPTTTTTTSRPELSTTDAPGYSLECWRCTNDRGSHYYPYDVNCGSPVYVGDEADHVEEDNHPGSMCYTEVWENGPPGYVNRYLYPDSSHVDGDCYYGIGYTACYCTGDLCNEGLCQHCFTTTTDEPTTTTKVTTTSTTLEPTTTTTSRPEPSTTDAPGDNLRCYSCIGCSIVDASTPVIEDPAYRSCLTKFLNANAEVLRGGSPQVYPDGECIQEGEFFTCYCNYDLCNDKH